MRLWTAVGAVLVFCALFLVSQVQNKPQINSALKLEPMSEQFVHVPDASFFNSELDDEKDKNLYLCRPEKVDADKYYYGSISLARINVGQSSSSLTFSRTEEDRENHAIHEVHVLKRVNDDWVEIENEETGKFRIKFAWDNMSVRWFLQEDAHSCADIG